MGERCLDAGAVVGDRLRELHEGWDTTAPRPLEPLLEEGDGVGALEREHLAEGSAANSECGPPFRRGWVVLAWETSAAKEAPGWMQDSTSIST